MLFRVGNILRVNVNNRLQKPILLFTDFVLLLLISMKKKIPEIAASSLVRGGISASPQSQGSVAKILLNWIKSK